MAYKFTAIEPYTGVEFPLNVIYLRNISHYYVHEGKLMLVMTNGQFYTLKDTLEEFELMIGESTKSYVNEFHVHG